MDSEKFPTGQASIGLSQVAAIDDLDTARLALRWALERIASLQAAQQAAVVQTASQHGEISALRASEALTRWEASSLESILARLSPMEGLDAARLDLVVEQQNVQYRAARAALESDPSDAARRTIEDLSRREHRFALWRRVLEGRLLAESAQAQTAEAAHELALELARESPVLPEPPARESAETLVAALKEQLALAQDKMNSLEQEAQRLPELRARVEAAELACVKLQAEGRRAESSANEWRARFEALRAASTSAGETFRAEAALAHAEAERLRAEAARSSEDLAQAQVLLQAQLAEVAALRARIEDNQASEQALRLLVEQALQREAEQTLRQDEEAALRQELAHAFPEPAPAAVAEPIAAPEPELPQALARALQAEDDLARSRARAEQAEAELAQARLRMQETEDDRARARARAEELQAEQARTRAELESLRAAAVGPAAAGPEPVSAPDAEDAPAESDLREMAERLKAVSKNLRRLLMQEEKIEP